mmetsp:Transcript_51917/g.77509  ORF Transcript_51917/g.77509 Transcript_51917/m.77509 type:complete len:143 (-) Transcript_51917:14-442(-)
MFPSESTRFLSNGAFGPPTKISRSSSSSSCRRRTIGHANSSFSRPPQASHARRYIEVRVMLQRLLWKANSSGVIGCHLADAASFVATVQSKILLRDIVRWEILVVVIGAAITNAAVIVVVVVVVVRQDWWFQADEFFFKCRR